MTYRRIQVTPCHRELSRKVGSQLVKSTPQGSFEGRPLVLCKGFLSNEDRDQFGFGQFDHGKTRNRLGESIPLPLLVKGNRQMEPLAHKIQIALDRLDGHLDVRSQTMTVGELSRLDGLEDLLHPVEWWPGVEGSLG